MLKNLYRSLGQVYTLSINNSQVDILHLNKNSLGITFHNYDSKFGMAALDYAKVKF